MASLIVLLVVYCVPFKFVTLLSMALVIKQTDSGIVYQCSCCGQEYAELPLCFGTGYPDYYFAIPPDERESRVEMTESLCVIDGEHFFHRGRLTIPINDYDQDLIFNVWATVSKQNFEKRNDLWNNADRVNEPPYFGWMQTVVPTYGDTINITTQATENEVGLIPTITVTEEGHRLTEDQQNGINLEQAMEIVGEILSREH